MAALETTVHDFKTHLSQYGRELSDGTYDEIIIKNRSTPVWRLTRCEEPKQGGLKLGIARELGLPPIDMDAFFAMDKEIEEMFEDY